MFAINIVILLVVMNVAVVLANVQLTEPEKKEVKKTWNETITEIRSYIDGSMTNLRNSMLEDNKTLAYNAILFKWVTDDLERVIIANASDGNQIVVAANFARHYLAFVVKGLKVFFLKAIIKDDVARDSLAKSITAATTNLQNEIHRFIIQFSGTSDLKFMAK